MPICRTLYLYGEPAMPPESTLSLFEAIPATSANQLLYPAQGALAALQFVPQIEKIALTPTPPTRNRPFWGVQVACNYQRINNLKSLHINSPVTLNALFCPSFARKAPRFSSKRVLFVQKFRSLSHPIKRLPTASSVPPTPR